MRTSCAAAGPTVASAIEGIHGVGSVEADREGLAGIPQNGREKPLRTFEAIVQRIGNTRTDTGLRVKAKLDRRKYSTGSEG